MKTKLCVVLVAGLAIWSMKRYYSDASADALWWILSPTGRLAGAVTGAKFAFAQGEGYVSADRLFVIGKSCAGINFMIAAFGMLTFALLHRAERSMSAARVLTVSLLASYGAAVLVNATRIAIALWLAAHPVAVSTLMTSTGAEVHRVEGIAVYFGGLVLLYEIVRRADRGGAFAGSER
jgi:exosortase K